ncbi:1-(5-phosphoribosyl)-5-[(5-phosphoribosylamino)methylideneamino]imidazole-4-carboxamide isomerase [Desulfoferrobacter suflitae]|uniref:1-(5-phosphoribosyl)-5-[(5- phosphoribosylamino)methylideneamino]imidazole-4- carboxamide isomerase n=1 Tax=Desulfoferrobacter suflitae TaxID=2865782 RepID=UPI0021640CD3|nr:1-(5-phosphoribosyl)-5-[(5-phosphoribosylamino)methylideneamino]imidazole-4-carboxamide isomerase [Desulfoferrobacter suflitae]MCK8601393.1 1-(5-phosphoribosyl)-5-[(5-phosphoribosylamino)methylideneamino]imidazole-4-carboxamide isomerase [Desulfoferrobacter suflitae]
MIVFPAIDLKDGQCVRLMQGDLERMTVYGKNPVAMARRWEREGAEWLHVVDLDGAFSQGPKNRQAVRDIVQAVSIPVQVGGGIRRLQTVEDYLGLGVARVIIGTAALRDPELLRMACQRHPKRVALGIDAREGRVAIEGWQETSGVQAVELVQQFAHMPLAAIIYTDIARDGMQAGVNIDATRRLLEATDIPVIASGGVAGLADIESLLALIPLGLMGVITGKAIYSGALQLKDALARVKAYVERSAGERGES